MGSGSSKCFSSSASSHFQEDMAGGRNDAPHGRRFSTSISRPMVGSVAACQVQRSSEKNTKCPRISKYQEERDTGRERQRDGSSSSRHSTSTFPRTLKTSGSLRLERLSRGPFGAMPNYHERANDTCNRSVRNSRNFLLQRSKSLNQPAFTSTSRRPKLPGNSPNGAILEHLRVPAPTYFMSRHASRHRIRAMDGDRSESIAGEQERPGHTVHGRNSSQMQRTPLTSCRFSGSSSVRLQSIQQAANQERQNEHTRNVEFAHSGERLSFNRSPTVGQHRVIQSSTNDAFNLCQRSSLNGSIPYNSETRFRDAFTRMSIDQYVNEESFAYRNESVAGRVVPEQQSWQMQSQALQRLRSRLESLSRNERAISYCRNQRNMTNNPSTSITRIVMLAEALFEVLDELHNQNETLSARSHGQSSGSLPAPDHIVKSFPTEVFLKDNGASEASQCYVCLMDYEEGDIMRSLPCQHKFHQLCIDKWLKEVHRVCPLCRGNVCASTISKKS